ncbi:hypothetical protein PRZ48_005759 [Zasmidium cellare]|uniref:BTB domain-containing protein n=1 Tax=Zasmidium cellare TaxID=395010 RepID=A0ABR0ELS9_ZASCE|nr:hypothetical protein PRZ48_005759 [Zasmidium cellare]
MVEMDDHDPPTHNAHYFNNAALSDVTIHFGDDNEQLKLHRVILASSSEHFRKMFEGGFAEATAKDIHLEDDDPEALYGLLAWCYGLSYNGSHTFPVHTNYEEPLYYGSGDLDDEGHLTYMAYLYVAADKYLMLQLKEHARQNFQWATIRFVERYHGVYTDPEYLSEFVDVLEEVATVVYDALRDGAQKLRPYLASAVHEYIGYLVDDEHFKKLMVDIPELSRDLLVMGTKRTPGYTYLNYTGRRPTLDGFVVPEDE